MFQNQYFFLQDKFRADTCNLDKYPTLHRKRCSRKTAICQKYNQDFASQNLFIPLSAVILFPSKLSQIYTGKKKKRKKEPCKESIVWESNFFFSSELNPYKKWLSLKFDKKLNLLFRI